MFDDSVPSFDESAAPKRLSAPAGTGHTDHVSRPTTPCLHHSLAAQSSIFTMRTSLLLRLAQNAKSNNATSVKKHRAIPYEVWPLIILMGGVLTFAGYRLTANFFHEGVRRGRQGPLPARGPTPEGEEH